MAKRKSGLTMFACSDPTPGLSDMNDDMPAATGDGDATAPEGDGDGDNGKDPPLASTGGTGMDDDTPPDNMGGAPSDPSDPELSRCAYATDELGMGGSTAEGDSVELSKNAFLGQVLVQSEGLALYTYGGDQPGTCDAPPVEGCSVDCAIAWPPFLADSAQLGEGLDPADFGTFERGDGDFQSTYRGWPLYLYKKDLAAGDVNGQGKASIWHAASPRATEVTVLRNAENEKFLVDQAGFTFYTLADDTIGDDDVSPVALCTGECRAAFVPFRGVHFSVATSLDATEFELFTSPGVGRQVAFRGQPLYLHVGDEKPFDTNGLGQFGAAIALF
jgi:predicted lipoprotein with Yx(FWY)xxD motif